MAFQWQVNGVNLSDDARITGSGTDQLTISNLQVSDSGVYTLVATNSLGATNSTPTVLTVNADVQRPIVRITNPAPGDKLRAVTFQAAGTAADNSQVSGVWFKLNSGPWTLAQTTDGWKSWYANFFPTNGVNTLSAYAVDQVGNASLTNAVTFSAVLQSFMFVTINGQGKVSPNYNWKPLDVGAKHTVTAMPGKGYIFAGWSGDLQSGAPKLSFAVTNELSVQANFVPNPFPAVSGKYVGTYFNTNLGQVQIPPIQGTLTVHVLNNGAYAATIQRLHFAGKFSADGTAAKLIQQKDHPPISVQLQLDLNGGNVLNATFTGSGGSTEITADRISN